MTLADELYARGEQLYRAGDYAAAEHVFRQLLETVPCTDGPALGRAAYSVGLCAMKLGRIGDARAAFTTALAHDPGLYRARERLAQLDEVDEVHKVHKVDDQYEQDRYGDDEHVEGHVVGVATNVRTTVTPHAVISTARTYTLGFRLQVPGSSQAPAVTMRGPKLVGSVEDGDHVAVPDTWRPGRAPKYVLNLSTGETVRMARGVRTLQGVVLTVFVALIFGFMVFVATQMGAGGP